MACVSQHLRLATETVDNLSDSLAFYRQNPNAATTNALPAPPGSASAAHRGVPVPAHAAGYTPAPHGSSGLAAATSASHAHTVSPLPIGRPVTAPSVPVPRATPALTLPAPPQLSPTSRLSPPTSSVDSASGSNTSSSLPSSSLASTLSNNPHTVGTPMRNMASPGSGFGSPASVLSSSFTVTPARSQAPQPHATLVSPGFASGSNNAAAVNYTTVGSADSDMRASHARSQPPYTVPTGVPLMATPLGPNRAANVILATATTGAGTGAGAVATLGGRAGFASPVTSATTAAMTAAALMTPESLGNSLASPAAAHGYLAAPGAVGGMSGSHWGTLLPSSADTSLDATAVSAVNMSRAMRAAAAGALSARDASSPSLDLSLSNAAPVLPASNTAHQQLPLNRSMRRAAGLHLVGQPQPQHQQAGDGSFFGQGSFAIDNGLHNVSMTTERN